ncbi:hypothetical protein [Pseudomonas putida]|uniref:Uncharacterized protein n=1 Tax=Pseudomonas putida TaxID=303 RepID=A0A8I1EC88_PSEPU|nr:hypothetical protein [Pseudomonas putida]MBI6882866.1 hypothetical protein [Pseudomonas putida]
MSGNYIEEGTKFFSRSDEEMDPAAAIFIFHHADPAFWLWFGSEVRHLLDIDASQSNTPEARPRVDRYLHGIIRADEFTGGKGAVIRSMLDVLSHQQGLLSGCLISPPLSLVEALDERGPHSTFASARLLQYVWRVLGKKGYEALSVVFGNPDSRDMGMHVSAALCSTEGVSWADSQHPDAIQDSVRITILTATQISSLPAEKVIEAEEAFSLPARKVIADLGMENLPEWQLVPLLKGGVAFANELGIDLGAASLSMPIAGEEASIREVIFEVGHPGYNLDLHRYFCDHLIPILDPANVFTSKVWSLGRSMEQWLPGYISEHVDEFHAAIPPGESALERLIRNGVDKKIVMSHPMFSAKQKGKMISDELGI